MARKPPTDPARTKLARLLERCRTSGLHFGEALIGETGSADAAQALVWQAVACDAVSIGELHVRRFLLEQAMSAEGPAVLAAQLSRLPPSEDGTELLPTWPRDVDALVFRAMGLDALAFAGAEVRDDGVRLGLSFVRWRRGEGVAPDHAERIVIELARNTARGHVLGSYDPTLQALDERGVEERRIASLGIVPVEPCAPPPADLGQAASLGEQRGRSVGARREPRVEQGEHLVHPVRRGADHREHAGARGVLGAHRELCDEIGPRHRAERRLDVGDRGPRVLSRRLGERLVEARRAPGRDPPGELAEIGQGAHREAHLDAALVERLQGRVVAPEHVASRRVPRELDHDALRVIRSAS